MYQLQILMGVGAFHYLSINKFPHIFLFKILIEDMVERVYVLSCVAL